MIVLKNESTNSITDKYTMETYTFLTPRIIASGTEQDQNDFSLSGANLINQSLLNSAIVEINIHEVNHNFHNYYFHSKNVKTNIKTPRKKYMKEREGGNNMERIVFGKSLNNINFKQA